MFFSALVEKENLVPKDAKRHVRSERLRDYFDLQLRFAQEISEIASLTLIDAVAQYTNFYQRFGLGRIEGKPESPIWYHYVKHLSSLTTHNQRVQWTQTFFLTSPEEPRLPNRHHFGCFACDPLNPEGFIRIHFTNQDSDDGSGPLHRGKISNRKQELREMFRFIKSIYPSAKSVRGGSWLYNIWAYQRLFPLVYSDSCAIAKTDLHFDGNSSWGQFLDYRERVKPNLRDVFLKRLDQLDLENLWRAFPLPALRTLAPIDAFYEFYDVDSMV